VNVREGSKEKLSDRERSELMDRKWNRSVWKSKSERMG
jgi:hypothetical protein